MDDDPLFDALARWSWRVMPPAALFTLIYMLFLGEDFWHSVVVSLGVGLAFGLALVVVGAPIVFGLNMTKEQSNPFLQGLMFSVGLLVLSSILELILFQGAFIVVPLLSIFAIFPWSETFWGCGDSVAQSRR